MIVIHLKSLIDSKMSLVITLQEVTPRAWALIHMKHSGGMSIAIIPSTTANPQTERISTPGPWPAADFPCSSTF